MLENSLTKTKKTKNYTYIHNIYTSYIYFFQFQKSTDTSPPGPISISLLFSFRALCLSSPNGVLTISHFPFSSFHLTIQESVLTSLHAFPNILTIPLTNFNFFILILYTHITYYIHIPHIHTIYTTYPHILN